MTTEDKDAQLTPTEPKQDAQLVFTKHAEKYSKLLGEGTDSQMVTRFVQAMYTLCRNANFCNANNYLTTLEEIAACGILPIKEHMSWWLIGNQVVWSPSAKGLIYRLVRDGIVKAVDCQCVYAPDEIRFPYELLRQEVDFYKSDPETGKHTLDLVKKMIDGLKLDDPIVIKKPGSHPVGDAGLVGTVCIITFNDGSFRKTVLYKEQLLNIRDGFSKSPNSDAYLYTPWEMHEKSHIKEEVKYIGERLLAGDARSKKLIDHDNQVHYTIDQKANPQPKAGDIAGVRERIKALAPTTTQTLQKGQELDATAQAEAPK